jgi:hypothetical protein
MQRRARAAAFAVALLAAAAARAQTEPSVTLDGVNGAAALEALARECYEARLEPEMPSDSIVDCSAVIEERDLGAANAPSSEGRIVVKHRVRFTLLERAGSGHIGAEAWTETEELGSVIDQPVTAEEYLQRVQRVLTAVVARLRARGPAPWAGRYDSEQAWHLDAHLNAVRHCDANLESMTAESVARELESVGLRALDDDTRDRCEQLFTQLFEWGLARGDAAPSVAAYARYRAALPAEQRLCSGQLAPDASCRP